MEYKILNNGKAVIITRQPQVVYDDLSVKFINAPVNSTAIINAMGVISYRELKEDMCIIPKSKLNGVIEIMVAAFDGTTPTPKWVCEEITAEPLKDGGILISPNSLELQKIITDLKIENSQIRDENLQIKADITALQKRLDEIMNAYDFT